MKNTILLLFFLGITTISFSQNERHQKAAQSFRGNQLESINTPKSQNQAELYNEKYLISEKILPYFFIDNAIPSGFPAYNDNLSREQNANLVSSWAKNNISQIKPDYHHLINNPTSNENGVDLTPEHKKTYLYNNRDYILEEDELSKYFINNVIPHGFPKYDYSKDRKQNIITIKNWYQSNKNLVNSEYQKEVESYFNRK
jgi:hypothetical protein